MPQYKYEATKYGSLKYLTYLSSLKAGGGGGGGNAVLKKQATAN